MNVIAYITINILLFASWYIFLFRLKAFISFADRVTGAFILGLTQITATEMLLGVLLKMLYPVQLYIVNVLVSVTVLFFSGLFGKKELAASDDNGFKDIGKEIKGAVAWFLSEIKSDLILLSIFIFFFISVCWTVFLGYLFPSYTWDALWYHLPIVGYIIQSGAIQEVPNYSFIDQFINIFPKNLELFFLWNTIFLQSDVIVDLGQLLFAFAGIFAIYSIVVKLGIDSRYAIYASMLFFFTPVTMLQATTNYVDVAVSSLFIMAVNYLMSNNPEKNNSELLDEEGLISEKKRRLNVIFAGLTTGILLGSKGSGPLFVVVLTGAIIVQEIVRHFKLCRAGKTHGAYHFRRKVKHYFIAFFTPVLLLGGYWYIKNWVVYGNPVYPMEVSVFNVTLFRGLYGGIIDPPPDVLKNLSYWGKLFYVWMEKVEYYLYDSRLSGFGPLWFILFLPGMIFSFIWATAKRKYNFLAVYMIFVVTFFISIRNWNPRYVVFITGLGAISFGFMLDLFRGRKLLSVSALLLAGYTLLSSNSPCVTPRQIREFAHLPVKERTLARHAPFNIDLHARQEYGYWTWISGNISDGETLAYTFEPLFLSPLWNSSFTSKIAYMKSETYKEWLKKLGESDVTYILVRTKSEEDKWIENERGMFSAIGWVGKMKEKFKIVYADENYKIAKYMNNEN